MNCLGINEFSTWPQNSLMHSLQIRHFLRHLLNPLQTNGSRAPIDVESYKQYPSFEAKMSYVKRDLVYF